MTKYSPKMRRGFRTEGIFWIRETGCIAQIKWLDIGQVESSVI